MGRRLTVQELLEIEGLEDEGELFEVYALESVVPAVCSSGCEVEPDGTCPHGHPAVLRVLDLI